MYNLALALHQWGANPSQVQFAFFILFRKKVPVEIHASVHHPKEPVRNTKFLSRSMPIDRCVIVIAHWLFTRKTQADEK